MWIYAIQRTLYAIPIAVGVSIICFGLVYLAPGDPIQSLLPPDATVEDVAMIRRLYGLDQPLPIQYLEWLMRALTGDLGTSLQTNRPVSYEVFNALGNTLSIAIGAVLLAFILAFALGTLAAYNRGKLIDKFATGISAVGISIPNYWLAIVLVIVFAVTFRVLPATGMGSGGSETFNWFDWNQVKYAVLPMLTLAMIPLGVVTRSTRSAVADTLGQDFVQMLRAKGLSNVAILTHAVRNALPQILAVMGLQLGYLIGGSILIETIFTWPGTGFLMSKAILTRDIPLLQGTILVLALSFVLINLVVDLLQTLVDPRIKRA
ncbi:ABC transporter permease [Devosia pacifica]|uniref:ABC transporter permease n=1 Tax=Devosia pacifica TaxID=1335967 RepID=A0A918S303_9HYPH|nr:ABC transporter permease [Devosia pacifica]GHA19177.1 ABC transporter permease [Devosia pacifica]